MLTELGKLNRDMVKGSTLYQYYEPGTGNVVISEKDFVKDTSLLMEVMGLVNKGLIEFESETYIWIFSKEQDYYVTSLINYSQIC